MAEKHTKEHTHEWKLAGDGTAYCYDLNCDAELEAYEIEAILNALAGYEPDAVREVVQAAKKAELNHTFRCPAVTDGTNCHCKQEELAEALARLEEQK